MADYTVSSTNVNLQNAAKEVGAAVDAVGSVYPKLLYLQKTLTGEQFKQYVGGIAAGEEAKEQTAIIDTSYKDVSYIDPFTAYNIFDQVLWPAISVLSPGWSENPYNQEIDVKDQEFYMRGVPLIDIFDNNTLSQRVATAFSLNTSLGFLDKTKMIDKLEGVGKKYTQLKNQYTSTSKTITLQKDVLYSIFTSEAAAKSYFISTYLNDNTAKGTDLESPYRMIQADPYLAYLTMLLSWLGGIGLEGKIAALDRYKDKNGKSIRARIRETLSSENWHLITEADRPKTATLAVDMLRIFYEYIQKIRNEFPELYKNWMGMLLTERKSMINMLVITNERVNENVGNAFTFQSKPAQYQKALSTAYKEFKMEIGD